MTDTLFPSPACGRGVRGEGSCSLCQFSTHTNPDGTDPCLVCFGQMFKLSEDLTFWGPT